MKYIVLLRLTVIIMDRCIAARYRFGMLIISMVMHGYVHVYIYIYYYVYIHSYFKIYSYFNI